MFKYQLMNNELMTVYHLAKESDLLRLDGVYIWGTFANPCAPGAINSAVIQIHAEPLMDRDTSKARQWNVRWIETYFGKHFYLTQRVRDIDVQLYKC